MWTKREKEEEEDDGSSFGISPGTARLTRLTRLARQTDRQTGNRMHRHWHRMVGGEREYWTTKTHCRQ